MMQLTFVEVHRRANIDDSNQLVRLGPGSNSVKGVLRARGLYFKNPGQMLPTIVTIGLTE